MHGGSAGVVEGGNSGDGDQGEPQSGDRDAVMKERRLDDFWQMSLKRSVDLLVLQEDFLRFPALSRLARPARRLFDVLFIKSDDSSKPFYTALITRADCSR